MTILPKKKASKSTKDKSDSESDGDSGKSRSSPRAWPSVTSSQQSENDETTSENRVAASAVAAATAATDGGPSIGGATTTTSSSSHRKKKALLATKKSTSDDEETGGGGGGGGGGDGYNSADEHEEEVRRMSRYTLEDELRFEKELKEKRGFVIKRMIEDGACLFRAVADQVYGDQDMHHVVRQQCMDYMLKNRDYFSQYVTEDFTAYVNRKRSDGCHGNNLEMQAMSEMYNRLVEVYQYTTEPINTFHGIYKTDNAPIRISYHLRVHYNSVSDPYAATVGVGLGFANFKPGLADRMLLSDSVRASELDIIEKTMLEDKMRSTDWEATGSAIEEAVARESYFEWLKENEKRSLGKSTTPGSETGPSSSKETVLDVAFSKRKRNVPAASAVAPPSQPPAPMPQSSSSSPPSSPSASAARTRADGGSARVRRSLSRSPRHSPYSRSPNSSPLPSPTAESPPLLSRRSPCLQGRDKSEEDGENGVVAASGGGENASGYQDFMDSVPPSMLGIGEWEDDGVLAAVLAASQQEYLDKLKNDSQNSTVGCSKNS